MNEKNYIYKSKLEICAILEDFVPYNHTIIYISILLNRFLKKKIYPYTILLQLIKKKFKHT